MQAFLTPLAILGAGALIAAAVLSSDGSGGGYADAPAYDNAPTLEAPEGALTPAEVTSDDYIYGNPDAPITLIEYSDIECPFCARLHPTLENLVDNSDGEINWVYRHLPLTAIHARATGAAIATECAGRLGGNDDFWTYLSTLMKSPSTLGNDMYMALASEYGYNADQFAACLNDASLEAKVVAHSADAARIGGQGTPYTVAINKDGDVYPFSGALPVETIEGIINELR